MKESEWTRKICKELEQHNALVFAIVGGPMQTVALPDRYVHHAYWCGWLEFKGAQTRLTPLQKKRIDELNRRRGGSAFVVRYPGLIESTDGIQLGVFHNTTQLLEALEELAEYYQGMV